MATSASRIPAEVAKTRKTRLRPRKAPSPSTKWAAARAARVCQRGGSDEGDTKGRAGRERDAGQEDRPALAEHEGAEQDPDREDDAVQQALGEERPGDDERGHVLLADGLDPQQVAAA